MNRLLILPLGALAGAAAILLAQGRSATADSLVLYGEAPADMAPDGRVPVSVRLADRTTGKTVLRADAVADVKGGRYTVELDGDLPADGLYAVEMTGPGDQQVASTFVNLQTTTPGTAQTGNVNITGTIRAGRAVVTSALNPTLEVRSTSTAANANTALFEANSSTGRGLLAIARGTNGTGGQFEATNVFGRGLYSVARGTSGTAAQFQATGSQGRGLYVIAQGSAGIAGLFESASGFNGTALLASATSANGNPVAGRFRATPPGGIAIEAKAPRVAIRAITTAPGVAAIIGETGVGGNAQFGVYGKVTGSFVSMRGVVGQAPIASGNFGVFANGDSGASGTKSFLIDHPLDPENQDLMHYSAEGPEPLLMYQGNVRLDASGGAWVQLPSYWSSINRDPRYQLTPIGAGMPGLHVASEVQGNRFRIAGGAPNGKVTWTVSAVRNDRRMQMFPAPTEVAKPSFMRGFYRAPEMFGFGPERGEMGAKEALFQNGGQGGNGGTP